MYTFGILAAFFLILSGIIFGKRIKQNQFIVVLIVFVGTMIGSIIVNGVLGMKIPYTPVVMKERLMVLQTSKILTIDDTIEFESYLQFFYEVKKKDSTIKTNWLDIGDWIDPFYGDRAEKLKIFFLAEGDTIPYYKVLRGKRLTDSKWISPSILPRGGRRFEVYIPNDSIHNVLMDQINEKFYIDEESKEIAKLD